MSTWSEQRAKLEAELEDAICTQEEQEECGDLEDRLEAASNVEDCHRKLKTHLEKQDQS